MRTRQRTSKNGRTLRNVCALLMRTGQGVRMAANTGYRAGYFMAKHPEIELTKDQIIKNYRTGLIALTGIGLGIVSYLLFKKS